MSTSTFHLGIFSCCKSTTWVQRLYFPSTRWGFFRPEKSWRLQPGLNPRTWVLKGSTLPLDHRSLFDVRYSCVLTETHRDGFNLLKKDICKVVPVCMPRWHSGEWRFSPPPPHTHTQPQHNSKWTWMVCFVPGHPHALWTGGWVETRTGTGTLEQRKISSPARNQTMMPQLSNLWPTWDINYAISALSDTCIH
jgi:hypothetical protein